MNDSHPGHDRTAWMAFFLEHLNCLPYMQTFKCLAGKKGAVMAKSIDPVKFEKRLIEKSLTNAQELLDSLIATPGLSVEDLMRVLTQDAWKPFVKQLKMTRIAEKQAAAEPVVKVAEAPKKRGRKKKVEAAAAPAQASNRAKITKGNKRLRTTFTRQQKEAQKKLIYRLVANNEGMLAVPQIFNQVIKEFPDIKITGVRGLVEKLAGSKYLSPVSSKNRTKGSPINYRLGSMTMENA